MFVVLMFVLLYCLWPRALCSIEDWTSRFLIVILLEVVGIPGSHFGATRFALFQFVDAVAYLLCYLIRSFPSRT